uniref:NADH-ubiquinone oxidoreductase chain 2 n=1 Tax=Parathailocyba orla TaxID=2745910 RepID=A0A7D5AUA1_9HEMI|nr:NADH dehydrogenase subunit 2 [Parathailocyba orla]
MFNNTSKMLFMTSMLMGIIMSISSNNWLVVWCGLEISLISMIPMMSMFSKLMITSESTMKYFIIQTISSSMLMMSMLTMIMKGDYNYSFMLTTSLMMKTGMAPFHNWVLTVIEGLQPTTMFIMLTINKIAPLTLMSYLIENITLAICITLLAGSIMGMNQNSIKKLIGYSSIFNMGLIIIVIKSNLMWMFYLIIYSTILFMLILNIKENKMTFINQSMFMESLTKKMFLWINLLSMGGMPPLMGFSIKYMTLNQLILMKCTLLASILVVSSLLVMFFYLRITFTSIMNNSIMKKTMIKKLNNNNNWISSMNMFTTPMILLTKSFN